VQEALTNVVRHAGASFARITVQRTGDAIRCAVNDDGDGLPEERSERAGIGLIGIRERLAAVGGGLRLGKSHAGGAKLEATVPLVEDV